MKNLKDLTLEELWELFPIVLTPYDPRWTDWANEEIMALTNLLSGFEKRISHIGSTAIPGIMAKPIVDILVETPPSTDHDEIRKKMESAGYICMAASDARMSFNKGYTPEGSADRVFHIHFHPTGDNDEISFRDYLISHPDVAKEYENLKLSLLPRFKHDRDAYTAAKTDFVKSIKAAIDNQVGTHSSCVRPLVALKNRYFAKNALWREHFWQKVLFVKSILAVFAQNIAVTRIDNLIK